MQVSNRTSGRTASGRSAESPAANASTTSHRGAEDTTGPEAVLGAGWLALEFHQLDLRYEDLRVRRPGQERRLLASLAERGQQVPIVVVGQRDPGKFLVIEGHKRVRALRRLHCDTVLATVWAMTEVDALILSRSFRQAEAETALEQGWLLATLQGTAGLDSGELARRFDRSVSWVSRRLGLVEELPQSVQEHVRVGRIGAHAAMKHLLPLARANRAACEALAAAIAKLRLSTNEVGQLWAAWRAGVPSVRQRVVEDPQLFLRARQEAVRPPLRAPAEALLRDLDLLASIARRVLRQGPATVAALDDAQRTEATRALDQAMADLARLRSRLTNDDDAVRGDAGETKQKEEKTIDADTRTTHGDPGITDPRREPTPDRPHSEDLAQSGGTGDRGGDGGSARPGASRESRAAPQADPGALGHLQGQPGPGP
jgi:ParB/RepB/Spo0J family partition protein